LSNTQIVVINDRTLLGKPVSSTKKRRRNCPSKPEPNT